MSSSIASLCSLCPLWLNTLAYYAAGLARVRERRGAAKRGGAPMLFARVLAAMARARFLKQPLAFFIAKTRHDDLVFIRDLIESGTVRPAIERTYPLAEVREAVRYALTGQARATVVLTVD